MYLGHLDLNERLVWTVEDALSAEDCVAYVAKIDAAAAVGVEETAPIVGHDGGPEVDLAVRNNTRMMWDSQGEADGLLARVRESVPQKLLGMRIVGANPRLRIYRYLPGQRHGAHWDTVVEIGELRSLLTLVFYLNDGFEGGETDFPELEKKISPRAGRALIFQHRILHEATAPTTGTKFVLRTDIMYGPP
jgi:prolyl 4-hydroxylase